MAWFFRAVQDSDGIWACRRGLAVLDRHASLDEALRHLQDLAAHNPPAVVMLHWNDGRIEQPAPPGT